MAAKMLYADVTDKILKAYYTVYNTLGYGFLEKVYENALLLELAKMNLRALSQQQIDVYYDRQIVGHYFADIVVNDEIILEIKAIEQLRVDDRHQLLNYLRGTNKEVGLLLNFGKEPEFKRVVFTNDRKKHQP